MSGLLDVEDLHVRLGAAPHRVHAVRGISFSVSPGETVGIVGESGCGKSTTALALMGLLPAGAQRDFSRLALGGIDLDQQTATELRGNRMAMVFQEPSNALNPTLTVGDQLEEAWLRHRPGGRRVARGRALELLARVGITRAAERLGQYPHQLSGGLCQRVMIAMALMCEPALLIADEPTTALDATTQAQVLRLLRGLRGELGLGMVLITHDLGVVSRVADRVAVMYAGAFVETAPVRALFGSPRHPYTQALLAALPAPGSTAGRRLAAIEGRMPDLAQPIEGCAFRDRCPYAAPVCAEPGVPVFEAAADHRYRCVRPPIG